MKHNYLKLVFMVAAWLLFCPLISRADELNEPVVFPASLNIYLFQPTTVEIDNVEKTVYVQSEVIELTSYDNGQTFRTLHSVSLPADQCFVIAEKAPQLYSQDENGHVDTDAVKPLKAGDTISLNILYQTDAKSGNFVYNVTDQTLAIKKPVYFAIAEKGSDSKIESALEMFTKDDETYTVEKVEIPKGLYFGITTTPDKNLSLGGHGISADFAGCNIYDGDYNHNADKAFKGNITAKKTKNTLGTPCYYTTFEDADFPSTIYFAVLDKNNKVSDYYEFSPYTHVPTKDNGAYADFNYELGPLSLMGNNTDSGVKYIVTRYKPVVGKVPFNTPTIDPTVVDETGLSKTYTFNFKTTVCNLLKLKENYYGKVWMTANDEKQNTFVLSFEKMELRPGFEDSYYFDEAQPLLDKTVYSTTPEADRRLLESDTKPLYHDNAGVTDNTIMINGVERPLVKMEERHALVGPGMHINRLSAGSLASVINVNTGFENIVDEDLDNCADIVGIANVQLASAPLLSVKDTKRYYARGTQCGFNIVGSTSGASGTSVLSLSVVEALSIAFYRDGELMCVKAVDTAEGQGVGLNLITVSSGDGSYNLTTTAPCVFDEIAIWTASGLKLNVGNDLKINYAWVGKEKEITLGTKGIAKYNEEHPGANLRVARKSTTWDAAGIMTYEFTGDEDKTENILNTANLLTGGVGWAEVCMDEDGHDEEQVFKKGSRINFVLEGGSILDLGLFTGNTITLYKRVVTGQGDSRKVSYDMIKAYPLSATVLELDVVKIQGKDVVSMVAPEDFSGSRLTISGGLVNVGAKNIYYASVTPPPYFEHRCDFRMPTTIFLTKEETRYIKRTKETDENGKEVIKEELVKTTVSYPSSYVPKWNTNAAETLVWSFAKDENGNDIVPANSAAAVNPSTGEITGIDVVNAPGVYKLHYQNPEKGHEQCYGDINIVVKESLTYADDAELASIIGRGLLATDEDFQISSDTHDVPLGGGGIHIGATGKPNGSEILDGSLMTATTFPTAISLAENELLCGIKLKPGKEKLGGKGKTMRLGFIVETPVSALGLDALKFLNIRCYDNDSINADGKCSALFGNSLAPTNTGVGLKLIGSEKVVKQRISVEVPAQETEFDEYQLWTSGLADVNLSQIKIYGTFYEYLDNADEESGETPGAASSQFSQWLPDGAEVICETAKVFPIKVGTVSVGTEIARLCRLVDDDNMISTNVSWGTGAEVGTGTSLLVDMGRTVTTSQKVGIYTQNIPYALEAEVGDWMTINTYRSEGMENGTVGRYEGVASSSVQEVTPQDIRRKGLVPVESIRVPLRRVNGEETIKDKDSAIDHVTDWKVVGASVAGINDRSGSFFKPSQDFDLLEIQIGEIVGALGVRELYAITTCAATDDVVKYVYIDDEKAGVDVEPAQLLRLTDKGHAAMKELGLETEDAYITYPAEGKPVYTAGKLSEYEALSTRIADADDATHAKIVELIRNPENVVWTANYLMDGDDADALAALKAKNADQSGVELYMGNDSKKVKVDQQQLEDGRRVVGFFNTDGSLDSQNFTAEALYWYKDGEEIHSLNVESAAKEINPVMPAAYGLRYKYSTERDVTPFVEDAYIKTVSSVVSSDGTLLKEQIDRLIENDQIRNNDVYDVDYSSVDPKEKNMKVGNLTHHHLNCDFTYHRPNVETAILKKYDVYMMASFRNNFPDEVDPTSGKYLEPVLKWVKDDGVERNDNIYRIKAVKVNPLDYVSPQVSVRNTFFAPVGAVEETEEAVDKAFAEAPAGCKGSFLPYTKVSGEDGNKTLECEYKDEKRTLDDGTEITEKVMRVEAQNTPDRRPTFIDDMDFELYHNIPDETYRWRYTGKMKYYENGDYIDNSDDDDNDLSDNENLWLNPSYYDVEAFIPSEDESFRYVKTGEDGKEVWDNYYDYGKIFQTVSYEDDKNPSGQVGNLQSNPANAGTIAIFSTNTKPIFVLTPVYIYYRQPEAVAEDGVDSDDVNGLIPIEKSQPAEVNRKKAVMKKDPVMEDNDSEQIDPNDMSGQFIVKRGGVGVYPVEKDFDEIVTELKELQMGGRAVIAGEGFLDILGTDDAEVYGADGVMVARGGGRHYLEQGVYVVRAGGRTTKHLVR